MEPYHLTPDPIITHMMFCIKATTIYLNPIRDMPWIMNFVRTASRINYAISLMGMNTLTIVSRIRDPLTWYGTG